MRVRLVLLYAVVVMATVAGHAQERSAESFKRSPVSALNASGKLQLVEFYHPT